MTDRLELMNLARRSALPAGCLAVMAYFAFHAVAGPTGLLAWHEFQAQHVQVQAEADKLKKTKLALSHHVDLLDPHHVDPDLADELVRRDLNVVRPDEVIVQLPEPAQR